MKKEEVAKILRNREDMLEACKCKKVALQMEMDCMKEDMVEEDGLYQMYQTSMEETEREERIIRYVWFYYLQLPEVERQLLEELYVKNSGWLYVEERGYGSKSTISRQKNRALSFIAEEVGKVEKKS